MLHIKQTDYYQKKGFPYGCRPSGRSFYPAAQTIFFPIKTPTGRYSKYWEAYHYKDKKSIEVMERDAKQYKHIKLPKGYTVCEPCYLWEL